MVKFELHHNPFTDKSKLYMNGKIYVASSISKFLSQPFSEWVDKIIDNLTAEANDEYSLTYVGFECYGRILRFYAEKESDCKIFSVKMPTLNNSITSRLNKLNLLCQNGLELPRSKKLFNIYSELDEDTIKSFLPKIMKLAFCRVNLQICPICEIQHKTDEQIGIIISENEPNYAEIKNIACYIQISEFNKFCGFQNGVYVERCDTEKIRSVLSDCLDINVYFPLLKNITLPESVSLNSQVYNSFTVLKETEPQIIVRISNAIEYGTSAVITYEVLPSEYKAEDVLFFSHNTAVITISDNKIYAVGTGETFIEARRNDEIIGRYPVKSYKRTRAKSIYFDVDSVVMDMSESISLTLQCDPVNADDVALAVFKAENDAISIVRKSHNTVMIKGIRPAKTSLAVKLGNLFSSVMILVYPKLQYFDIELSKTTFTIGELSKISINATPFGALIGELHTEVSPTCIARYDRGVNALLGKTQGVGKLSVTDIRSGYKAYASFTVI
jgi:hypothetical protein